MQHIPEGDERASAAIESRREKQLIRKVYAVYKQYNNQTVSMCNISRSSPLTTCDIVITNTSGWQKSCGGERGQ